MIFFDLYPHIVTKGPFFRASWQKRPDRQQWTVRVCLAARGRPVQDVGLA